MKKSLQLIMLICLAQAAFTQQIPATKKHLSAQAYRQQSGDQIVLGSILLAGGTALAFAGANMQNNATGFDFTGSGIELLGIMAAGGSIPLFISAVNNHAKGKAIAVSMKPENVLALDRFRFSAHSYPALSIKINL
ncbi:MAG: hypothetical protein ABIQ88_18090 [Chitinophagaceae bacterium]